MKLVKLKCSNEECKREFYVNPEDVYISCADGVSNSFDTICPFCTTYIFNRKYLNGDLQSLLQHEARQSETLNLGEIEFDDKSNLERVKIQSLSERLTEILHELENMGVQDDSTTVSGG